MGDGELDSLTRVVRTCAYRWQTTTEIEWPRRYALSAYAHVALVPNAL